MDIRVKQGKRTLLLVATCALTLAAVGFCMPHAAAGGEETCNYENNKAKVRLLDDGSSAVVSLTGPAITMNGSPCGLATLANTSEINVKDTSNGGSPGIIIDLSGGQFMDASGHIPFKIDLRTGTQDLFGVAGSTGDDFITLGSDGANLQDDAAGEVTFVSRPDIGIAATRDGEDRVCARGGAGTGETSFMLWGMSGGAGPDKMCGGGVTDIISGSGGDDRISGYLGGDVLRGKKGADRIAGQRGNDRLFSGGGPDALLGGIGIDRCRGGAGTDESSSC